MEASKGVWASSAIVRQFCPEPSRTSLGLGRASTARVRPALCSTTSRATSMLRASAYLHQCATGGNLGWVSWYLLESLLQTGVYANQPKSNSIFPGVSKVGSVHTLCFGVATVAPVSPCFDVPSIYSWPCPNPPNRPDPTHRAIS